MNNRYIWIIPIFLIGLIYMSSSFAQIAPMPQYITQGNFSILVCRAMGIEKQLPITSLPIAYARMLERLKIAPLEEWRVDKILTNGDMAVILARALGLEDEVLKKIEKCKDNIFKIEQAWAFQFQKNGYLRPLSDLLNDRSYFTEGAPRCPFGLKYEDAGDKHKIVPHSHLNAITYMSLLAKMGLMEMVPVDEPMKRVEVNKTINRSEQAKIIPPSAETIAKLEAIGWIYKTPASPVE